MRTEDFDFVLVGLHFDDRPCSGHVCGEDHVALSGDGERAVHRRILSRGKDWDGRMSERDRTRVHSRNDRSRRASFLAIMLEITTTWSKTLQQLHTGAVCGLLSHIMSDHIYRHRNPRLSLADNHDGQHRCSCTREIQDSCYHRGTLCWGVFTWTSD